MTSIIRVSRRMLTLLTELAGQDAKPAFIGIIYRPLAAVTVPADAATVRRAPPTIRSSPMAVSD